MSKKIPLLLSLGLVLLLSLASGCKKEPEKSVVAGVPAGQAAPGAQGANPQSPSAAGPGQPAASPALPGAQPGSPGAPALAPDKIPAVVARVNGKEIKRFELLDGSQMVQVRMAQAGRPISPTADFYRTVLQQLIDIDLLQEDARAQGVTVPEEEVQKALAARKRNFPSEEAYKQALAKAGVTEKELLDRTRDQLTLQKFIETKLAPLATVPDQAVRDFYDKHQEDMKVPERLRLRHILVAVDPKAPPADREKAKQKAQDVLKRLQGGEDFAKLAQQYSDDLGSKSRGGDLGPIAKGQAVPPIEAAAFALKKPNDLSPVVETSSGYHIIQLVERLEPSLTPFEQVKDRIAAFLKQQEVQKVFHDRAIQLRAKSKVEVFI
jgi:peptidyl-prolyl cis-trans isomerase C